MNTPSKSNLYLGLCCLAVALLFIAVWIPLDTDTGIVEKVRRRLVVGDALAPTIAAVFLLIGGMLLLVFERKAPDQMHMSMHNVRFIASLIAVLIISFSVMRFAGPMAVWIVNLATGEALEYRLLRDTAPWKYIGYFFGGTLMITGLIALIENGFSPRGLRIGVLSMIVMTAVYDLPFDDILLPPNGDV